MAIKLEDAVAVVQKEIRKWREKYESVANENGQDHPIMVEGETIAGYFCQLMVNPQEVAKIFVDYDYALYRVLGEDAPDAMWEDLGRFARWIYESSSKAPQMPQMRQILCRLSCTIARG